MTEWKSNLMCNSFQLRGDNEQPSSPPSCQHFPSIPTWRGCLPLEEIKGSLSQLFAQPLTHSKKGVTSSTAFELLIVVVCIGFIIYIACRKGAHFLRKAATPLCEICFSRGHALKEGQFLRSCVKDGAWTSTSGSWMPSGWRQTLEPPRKVLLQ